MGFSPKESSSDFIKKEFGAMQKQLKPLLIKCLFYSILSAPLFSISFVSISYLLSIEESQNILFPLLVFSLIGAFSIALFREALHKSKEMRETSQEYIKRRIGVSKYLDDHFKDSYLKKIHDRPKDMYKVFLVFLEHEYRVRQVRE